MTDQSLHSLEQAITAAQLALNEVFQAARRDDMTPLGNALALREALERNRSAP